jgi:uncharacterized protein with gpF-like domain
MAEKLGRLYTRYVDEVIANLRTWDKAYGRSKATVPTVESVLFDLDEAGKVFAAGLMPLITDTVDAGARQALATLEAGVWNIGRPEVVRWLDSKAMKVKTLPATMREQLRAIVQGGINDGVGAQEIAQRIQDVRPQYKTWMSERTARTETVGANNFGALDCYKQSGATQKQWITSLDDNVRDLTKGEWDHKAAHDEIVPVADQFVLTGEPLDAPGDPMGSPGNIINCRCTLVAAD